MGVYYSLLCTTCMRQVDLEKNKEFASLWLTRTFTLFTDREPDYQMLVQPIKFMIKHVGHHLELMSDLDDNYGSLCRTYQHDKESGE